MLLIQWMLRPSVHATCFHARHGHGHVFMIGIEAIAGS